MEPKRKVFESQQDDEEVIFVARKHWLTLFPSIIISFSIYITSTIVIFIFPKYFPEVIVGIGYNLYVLILSIFFVFATIQLFVSWIEYYLNVNILTNEHLVDVDQHSLFYREIAILNLGDIQDVSASIKGVIKTLFHYGDLLVQTAGEEPNFVFKNVPNPDFLAQKILETAESFVKENNGSFKKNSSSLSQNSPLQNKKTL